MGLVAFDGAAAVVTDLTADRQALMAGVNALAVGDGGPPSAPPLLGFPPVRTIFFKKNF